MSAHRAEARAAGRGDPDGYEVVIGLEVHCQLRTVSKLFSPAPVLYGLEPNHSVHPICLGLPGFDAGSSRTHRVNYGLASVGRRHLRSVLGNFFHFPRFHPNGQRPFRM